MRTMLVMAATLAVAVAQAAVPTAINYQGRLLDASGMPVTASVDIGVGVFDVESGGAALWSQATNGVGVTEGVYDFQFGNAGLATVLTNPAVWLQLTIDGETLTPRQRLVAVPYALRAGEAGGLSAGAATNLLSDAAFLGQLQAIIAQAAPAFGNLSVSPSPLSLSVLGSGTTVSNVVIQNTGIGPLATHAVVGYTSGSGWLSALPTAATLAAGGMTTVAVTVSGATISEGTFAGALTFAGSQTNGSLILPVSVTRTDSLLLESFDVATGFVSNKTALSFTADAGQVQQGTASLRVDTSNPGGADLTTAGWTATASGPGYSGWQPDRAFPENPGQWTSGQSQQAGEWYRLDLGAVRVIDQIRINTGMGDVMAGYNLRVSVNGSTWSTLYSGPGQASGLESTTFAAQDVRYIEWVLTASALNWMSIFDIYVRGVNTAMNGTVTRTLAAQDLSSAGSLKVWVRSDRTGGNVQLGIGEAAFDENLFTLTVTSVNTWEEKTISLAGVPAASRNAITRLGLKVIDGDVGFTLHIDDLRVIY